MPGATEQAILSAGLCSITSLLPFAGTGTTKASGLSSGLETSADLGPAGMRDDSAKWRRAVPV
ncbi:hypothetical protein B5V46_14080 [Rhodovulum sp. MB263]|nr:hypothetical protein B5V46_14080 [Rhodovulum sp. MB263]